MCAWNIRLTEAIVGSIVLYNMFNGNLERAILEALAYSDIFEYPLRLKELHRYLPMQADIEQLSSALNALGGKVGKQDGFYFLVRREENVDIRKQREARSRSLLPRAMQYGRVLGSLPFIRMVALTGSLAVMNVSKAADFDYMLVTVPGRVWTARAFAVVFGRITRLQGHTLCPNLIVSETVLEWPLHDLYSARELCQMVLIKGDDVYSRMMKANPWVKLFLPNCTYGMSRASKETDIKTKFQSVLESVLGGKTGERFEKWEMNRKIARFQKQAGFGEETVFNAEVCQGNFHHHRSWTKEAFEKKLNVIARRAKPDEAISDSSEGIASSPIGSSQ
jgi:hypothetical protein